MRLHGIAAFGERNLRGDARLLAAQGQLLEIGLDVSGDHGKVLILSEGWFKLFALARQCKGSL
jgi:hypothetical protein